MSAQIRTPSPDEIRDWCYKLDHRLIDPLTSVAEAWRVKDLTLAQGDEDVKLNIWNDFYAHSEVIGLMPSEEAAPFICHICYMATRTIPFQSQEEVIPLGI